MSVSFSVKRGRFRLWGWSFGVYLFLKTTFEWTGIPQEIPVLMAAARIPSSVLLIVFPFTMGLLTRNAFGFCRDHLSGAASHL